MVTMNQNSRITLISLLCCFILVSVSFINIPAERIDDAQGLDKIQYDSKSDSSFRAFKGTTLYVGGPGNYSSIQDAIDNASNGDIVYVNNGIYYENIIINKEILVTGENQANTIIDGGNSSITVTIDNLGSTLSNFTIQHGHYYGIYIDNGHNVFVHHNIIKNNNLSGIFGSSAISCIISDNIISNNYNGIFLNFQSRFCEIKNNTIVSQISRGVYLKDSYNNTIDSCNLTDNKIGIALHYCYYTDIVHNMISHHSDYGIGFKDADTNQVAFNYLYNNTEGVQIWEQSTSNTIHGNTIITSDNIAPFASDDSFSLLMNSSKTMSITQNDYDRDGSIDASSISIIDNVSHGSLSIVNDSIQYSVNIGYNGTDYFTYTIQDLDGVTSNVAEVFIHIIDDDLGDEINQEQNNVNRSLPIYTDWRLAQSVKLNAGTFTRLALNMSKLGNPPGNIYVDIHEGNITGDVVFSSSQPTSNISSTSNWVIFDGTDFITDSSLQYYIEVYTLMGNINNCFQWAQSTIDSYLGGYSWASTDDGDTWSEMNESDFCFQIYKTVGITPIAVNDTYYTTTETTLQIPDPGVLLNDHDYDEEPFPIRAILVSDVSNGTLSLEADGSFSYTPNYDFVGEDSFTYKATDQSYNSSDATVIINVTTPKKYCINFPSSVSSSIGNNIYHNNFYSGTFNPFVYDEFSNTWDNTSLHLIGGNYWSNFNEIGEGAVDVNHNDIYDDSYAIYGGDNVDQYPLALPWVDFYPFVNFSWEPIGPITDKLIQFMDTSSDYGYGIIMSWFWDFDDGNTSTHINPIHQYAVIGVYNVSLTITDNDGNIATRYHDVTIAANPPIADFSWDPVNASTYESVQFIDHSTDDGTITSWIWDFDDGNMSYNQHPIHVFTDNGVYNVTLTVGDNDGAIGVITKSVMILNVAPIAVNDSFIVNENTAQWLSVLTNDYDTDGILNISSLYILVPPLFGTIDDINTTTGQILYNPDTGYYGDDNFTYSIADDDGAESSAIVFLQIVHSNIAPVAQNDSYLMIEDTVLNIDEPGVLGNDTDADAYPDVLSTYLIDGPDYGSILLYQNGSFNYEPINNYTGIDSFIYQAYDGLNYSENATVTIIIQNINDAPQAVDDAYVIFEDTLFSNYAVSVLDNDIDSDNTTIELSTELMENATKGTLNFNGNGTFDYMPDENYSGTDEFTYRIFDGVAYSENATVLLTILNSNDAPVANNDSYTVLEDTSLTIDPPGVLENDIDVDSSVLTAINLSSTTHGILYFNEDGSFVYHPDADFYGFDSFTYQAFDGLNNSNIAWVTIQVINSNEPPVAENDSYNVTEDTWYNISAPGILSNDMDSDGPDPLISILIKDVEHGFLQFNSDGSFSYLPKDNFTGIDSFIYKAFDGLDNSSNTTVTLNVENINDPPVAVDNLYTIDEDTILYAQAPGVLSNDYDAESLVADLTAHTVTPTSNGALTLYNNGSFNYEPIYNFNGIDTFTYYASDGDDNSNTATVTIIVNSINDHPISSDENYSTIEDVELVVDESMGVLANDDDPDDGPQENLTAVLIKEPFKGDLQLFDNGSFIFTPLDNYYGEEFFVYQAFDGMNYSNETQVNITVIAINDPPVAVNDTYFTMENLSINITAPGFMDNDYDVDNSFVNITAELVTNTSNGNLTFYNDGSFNYTPDPGFNASDNFTYRLFDETDYSNIATVTISIVYDNLNPVANDDFYNTSENIPIHVGAPGILGNDDDPDAGPGNLTAILVDNATHGVLLFSSNGSFFYTPHSGYSGFDSFTYQAYDGLNSSNIATVWLNISGDNIPPVAYDDSYIATEDTLFSEPAPGVLGNDIDSDGGPLPLSAVLVDNVSFGNLMLYADGSFTYMPDSGFTGMDSFTYQAFDGGLYSNTATVWITVMSGNIPPVATDDSYIATEDTLYSEPAPGVLSNDVDPDGGPDPLTVVLIDNVSFGVLSFFSDGSFTYIPDENFSGLDSFSYQAYDGEHYSNVTICNITVTAVNDPPIALDDYASVLVDSYHVIDILANDYDIDDAIDATSVILTSLPSQGNASVDPVTGEVNYTPDIGYIGLDSFTYTVDDDFGDTSNIATVHIIVDEIIIIVNQSVFDRGFPIRHAADGDWAAAQSFIPTLNTVAYAELYMRKFGSPEFDLTVELRQGGIDGPLLGTLTFVPGDVPSSWSWFMLDFGTVSVTSGLEYFIVLPPAPSGVTTSFGYEWGYAFGNQYDDGAFWFTRDGGALWRDLPSSYEFSFKIYGLEE